MKGQTNPRIRLPGLEPGVGYAIFVTTVAGEDDCEQLTNNNVTLSETAFRLTAYTSKM